MKATAQSVENEQVHGFRPRCAHFLDSTSPSWKQCSVRQFGTMKPNEHFLGSNNEACKLACSSFAGLPPSQTSFSHLTQLDKKRSSRGVLYLASNSNATRCRIADNGPVEAVINLHRPSKNGTSRPLRPPCLLEVADSSITSFTLCHGTPPKTFAASPNLVFPPLSGTPGAPETLDSRNVSSFLKKYSLMCENYLVSAASKVKRVPEYYTDEVARDVEAFDGWKDKDWDKLTKEIKAEWRREDTGQIMYTRTFLERFVRQPRKRDGLKHYCRQFHRISTVLAQDNHLDLYSTCLQPKKSMTKNGQQKGAIKSFDASNRNDSVTA